MEWEWVLINQNQSNLMWTLWTVCRRVWNISRICLGIFLGNLSGVKDTDTEKRPTYPLIK